MCLPPPLRKLIMQRKTSVLALVLIAASAFGCADTTGKVKAFPVKGVVSLDGKPLAEGEVYFAAAGGQAPVVMQVKDGAFSGDAYPGSNKVEVRAYKNGPPLTTDLTKAPTKVNFIPDRFNTTSKLTAEVAAGAGNDYKFEIMSK